MFVYVCSPYSGDVEVNTQNARRYSRFAVEQGHQPITPHLLYPQFLDEAKDYERKMGLNYGLALIPKCHEIWVFGDRLSQGMLREVEEARAWKMTIRLFNNEHKEVT